MSPRRILLLIMLLALAACAAAGMFAIVARSSDTIWRLLGTALGTAIASSVLLAASLLMDRPKFRAGGLCCVVVIIICWLLSLTMIWSEPLGGELLMERAAYLFGQTLLTGLPAALALLRIGQKETRIAVLTFVVVACLAYALFVLGSILPSGGGYFPVSDLADRLWLTAGATEFVGALCCLLLVNLGCGDRRYFRWAGVLCAVAAYIVMLGLNWHDGDSGFWTRIMGVLLTATFFMAHANLVLMARLQPGQHWLQWATLACSLIAGLSASAAIITGDISSDSTALESMPFRISCATAIAAGCGSLGLIVLTLFNRKAEFTNAVATEFTEITLICPSCSTRQVLPLGDSVCKACSLKIFVKLIEPRCASCGYLLYKISSEHCPECGSVIRHGAPDSEMSPAASASPTIAAALPKTAPAEFPSH